MVSWLPFFIKSHDFYGCVDHTLAQYTLSGELAGLGNATAAAVVLVGLAVPPRGMAGRHPWLSLEGSELPIMCSLAGSVKKAFFSDKSRSN